MLTDSLFQDSTAPLPCGIMVLNTSSCIVFLNDFACELLGYEAQELVGKRVDTLLSVASRIYFQTHIYPLITLQKVANELYLNVQTRQRVQIPILLNARSQEQHGETLIYFSFIPVHQRRLYEQELLRAKRAAEDALHRNDELVRLQQVLEKQQAELDRQVHHLRQRNDELEQFSKVISHDLKEPLRKITLFVDLLSQENSSALTKMGIKAMSNISKATNRLHHLINDLQLYFTLTTDAIIAEPVDLKVLIQELALDYSSPDVLIDLQALPLVLGDRKELARLFGHLFDNAAKFRQSGKPATILIEGSVVSHNTFRQLSDKYNYIDYARITVSDTGIGFDNRQREEVFRILKKLDPHTPGIGLGLAIAKKITERHNGQITAQSAVGRGTKITVLLPIP